MTVVPDTLGSGGGTVTLTVTDVNGQSATCTAAVTVKSWPPGL